LKVFAPLRHEARSRYLQQLSDRGFPILYIATGEREPMISVDNARGIQQAVAHLADHGHRQIAFLSGDPNDKGDSQTRLEAFHSAMREHDLQVDPSLVETGWHTLGGGYEAAQRILHSDSKFSAVVSSDDISAIGAMQAIRGLSASFAGAFRSPTTKRCFRTASIERRSSARSRRGF
jgi:DNA-binding LacI/PurR family transcriptional regulator